MLGTLSDKENQIRHDEAKVMLSSLGVMFKVVQGFYKGQAELSFLILDSDLGKRAAMMMLTEYNQECILYSDGFRSTSLIFPDGTEKVLGTLIRVTNTQGLDSYTIDPETGQAWTVKAF